MEAKICTTRIELLSAEQAYEEKKLERETYGLLEDCLYAINYAVQFAHKRHATVQYWRSRYSFAEQVVDNVADELEQRDFFVRTMHDCNNVITICVSIDDFPVRTSLWQKLVNWFKSLRSKPEAPEQDQLSLCC